MVFLILLISAYLSLLIINILKKRFPFFNKLSEFLHKHLIWNFGLIFLNSQFVSIVLPCIINILNIKNDSRIELASAIFSFILLGTILLALMKCFQLVFSNKVTFPSRFLKESLKTCNSVLVSYWKLLWLLRWIVTLSILVLF